MAIDLSQFEKALAPAKATPVVDYSPWYQGADESLVEYYKRLAKTREGGILGTAGLMDVPAQTVEEKAKEETGGKAGEVVTGGSSEESLSAEDRFMESERGKTLAEGIGEEEARKAYNLQGAVDRLTGKAPTLNDALALLFPGMSLAQLTQEQKEELRKYIGSDSDSQMVMESLRAGGMTEDEVLRSMESRDKLGWRHGIGLADSLPTEDYFRDDGILGTVGHRLLGGLMRDRDNPATYGGLVSQAMMAGKSGKYSSMFDPKTGLYGGPGAQGAAFAPSFAYTAGNNFINNLDKFSASYAADPNGLFMQQQAIYDKLALEKQQEQQRQAEAARQAAAVREMEAARAEEERQRAAVAAANTSRYTDSYASDAMRSSGSSYTVSNSRTGKSASFSSNAGFGSGSFNTSGTFGD